MPRTKGSLNKKTLLKQKAYEGYFLMEGGYKIDFKVDEYIDEKFVTLHDELRFLWDDYEVIWLGERNNLCVLAKKIIGFEIYEI